MPRDWLQQLDDIQQAIRKIKTYVAGLDFEAFAADEKTQDGGVRTFAVGPRIFRTSRHQISATEFAR